MEVVQLERLARRQVAEIAIRRAAIANRELAAVGSLDTPGISFPPLVLTVATELSDVAPKDVNDVRTGKMEPWNLIRLHPSGTRAAAEYTSNPLVFFSAFLNYMWIYLRFFGDEHPGVVHAQNRFMQFIMQRAQLYRWPVCLDYAMRRLNFIKASSIHDAVAWNDHPVEWVNAIFIPENHMKPDTGSTQKRPRADTNASRRRKR
ncbi:hypothetical protein F4804DRAFT_218702 [Jackrogersella minutella]|nr:hypothetical protein F4804DRAFT_218702 [Jackrogersella minutella]